MRWSLASAPSAAAGRASSSWWLSSTRSVPPSSLTGIGSMQRAVAGAQVLEEPEALAGRPPELGVVALGLQLGEDHERQHDLVLGEARDRPRVGQQHRGVEDVDGRGDQGTGDASSCRRDFVDAACCTDNAQVGCLAWWVHSTGRPRKGTPVAVERTDAIIAGVNKAGTTSLFVSLSTHPDVAPSSIKETALLPARALRQAARSRRRSGTAYFADAGDRPVHLEATPSYFYGAERVAEAMRDRLVNPHALLVLREPVSRAISFFTYQKVRLRFPADYPIDRLPRGRRPPRRRRLPRSREREVHGVPRRLLRRLPAGVVRHPRDRTGARPRLRALVDDQAATLRTTADCARARPGALPRRRPQLREPHDRVQEQGFPEGGAGGQRPARAGAPAPPRGQAQAAGLLLPAQRPARRGAHPRRRCAPSWPSATRNPTPARLARSIAAGTSSRPALVAIGQRARSGVDRQAN